MLSENCQEKTSCRKSHCLIARKQHIYGLYDVRLHDIFYVGSSFFPAERFREHMRGANSPYNFKSLWLQNILENGSFPLPFLLYEFQSTCDQYTREVEHSVAAQLREAGHTAICDSFGCPSEITAYWDAFPSPHWEENISQQEARNLMYALYELKMNLNAKWMERIAEHAHITAMLKEMFEAG